MSNTTSEMDAYRLMKTCPRFNTCSAPACPLDLRQSVRPVYPGEPTCRATRTIRLRLAQGSHLPHGGLTRREVVREEQRKRWMAQPQDVRDAILKRLAAPFQPRSSPHPVM